jgi:hypothetical protein
MAYNADYLSLMVSGGPKRPQQWLYGPPAGSSQADAVATVRGAGFISDALARGMKVNDVVQVVDTTTPLVSWSRVSVVSSTGATLVA